MKKGGERMNTYSFCSQIIQGFQSILNPNDFDRVSYRDIDELERLSKNALKCIGQVLTSSTVINKDMHFDLFSSKNVTYINYLIALKNISELPIIYPRSVRCCAIKQIGRVVRRIGIVRNDRFNRLVLTIAEDFSSRLASFARMSSDFEYAYITSLGYLAVDLKSQQILLSTIEKLFKEIKTFDFMTQIAIFKAAQFINQPSNTLIENFRNYSKDNESSTPLSTYATLAFVSLSIKARKPIAFAKFLNFKESRNKIESKDEHVVAPFLKMVYQIALNTSDEEQKKCVEMLTDFIFGENETCKPVAFSLLTKLALRLSSNQIYLKLLEQGINHIKNCFKNKLKPANLIPYKNSENENGDNKNGKNENNKIENDEKESDNDSINNKLIFKIVNSIADIAARKKQYNERVYPAMNLILQNTVNIPKHALDYLIGVHEFSSHLPDTFEDFGEEEEITSVFDNLPQKTVKISEDADLVYKWRRLLLKIPNLLNFKLAQSLNIGNCHFDGSTISIPKKIILYEDIASCLALCCFDIFKSTSTFAALKRSILDPSKQNRNVYSIEQISQVMNPYNKLNHFLLFFAISKKPSTIDSNSFLRIIAELHFTEKYLVRKAAEQNNRREPLHEPKNSSIRKQKRFPPNRY
ncbi:hypothetical protein TRFO_22569 [Tritrichomonas foetus]|uniref:Uncharacterized protein n=1 Tax=Tritrichomonas foetus TaxID=1144522 RepID=A0A1J4KC61_9EUKA|nr:hypothetical protein TRFO_22569 [Tritrichomonas foetus]|eukprot:OHT08811.1 hypothetical protein TRFO_22569 [Tritrichomonas foetus]